MDSQHSPSFSISLERGSSVGEFLSFLEEARQTLRTGLASELDPEVEQIKAPVEEHYLDDRGQPAMYQRFESALYDDSRRMVTLWRMFARFDQRKLQVYHGLLRHEIEGLTGDRHPRKVFDRSPFGIAALVIGTITIWMTFLRNISGEDLGELLELVRFQWVVGSIWIGGLFVVLWYILKMVRNNRQVAFLATCNRALSLYLDQHEFQMPASRAG